MCPKVFANGDCSGKGTPVSIYAFLMRREHDDKLHWPFEGDAIVELLNWRKNKGHHKGTIEFNMNSHAESGCCVCLTAIEIDNGWSQPKFISHSSLAYKRTNNTE